MKTSAVFAFPSKARFPVKLICCIAFGSAQKACYLLKSIAIILYFLNNFSLANNQLYNHHLDLLQFFKNYHVIKSFLTG